MNKSFLALAAASCLLWGPAFAEPLQLTKSQLDGVTAGFGANNPDTAGSKFEIHHLAAADGGIQNNPSGDNPAIGPLGGVGVPSAVPTTISCGAPFDCAP